MDEQHGVQAAHPLISASILGADWLNFGEAVAIAEDSGADLLQIDVADGVFTPTITFGEELVRRIRGITTLPIEVHLMVSRPQDWFAEMADIGADFVLFHVEAVQRIHAMVDQCRKLGLGVGLVLNSETVPELLEYELPYVDIITLMAILPGFAGQPFIPETLSKIRRLREMVDRLDGHRPVIEVDGGINHGTASSVIDAGADVVVVSSGIYRTPDASRAVRDLREIMKVERPKSSLDGLMRFSRRIEEQRSDRTNGNGVTAIGDAVDTVLVPRRYRAANHDEQNLS